MHAMDMENLNIFFGDIDLPYQLTTIFPVSGQRIVYKAEHRITKEQFIIKIAPYDQYQVGRIQRELSILKDLQSKYFPKIVWNTFVTADILNNYFDRLDYANRQDSSPVIAAEINRYRQRPYPPFFITIENYVPNISWDSFSSGVTEKRLCELLLHCFQALRLLWDKRIVHRDLKPANILIRPDFSPVIIDLGIAKSLNEGTENFTLFFQKTPQSTWYASPEQLMNKNDQIDYKTDQYSLGIVAYEALTNGFPFGKVGEIGPEQLLKNMLSNSYMPVATHGKQCSEAFERIIKRLLMPYPYQRYRNVDAIVSELLPILGDNQ